MSLKSFLITEKLTSEHAERYLTFVDRYHAEVWRDLHQRLCAAWEAELAKIQHELPALQELVTHRELRSPGINSELQLLTAPHRITTQRHRHMKVVAPIVKVPYVYHHETVDLILKRLFKVAERVFEDTAAAWGEIFNYEKRGQVKPGFKIDLNELSDGLKFKIISSIEGEEAHRTIYSVQVDHGKATSKTKDYDRIYLGSHV